MQQRRCLCRVTVILRAGYSKHYFLLQQTFPGIIHYDSTEKRAHNYSYYDWTRLICYKKFISDYCRTYTVTQQSKRLKCIAVSKAKLSFFDWYVSRSLGLAFQPHNLSVAHASRGRLYNVAFHYFHKVKTVKTETILDVTSIEWKNKFKNRHSLAVVLFNCLLNVLAVSSKLIKFNMVPVADAPAVHSAIMYAPSSEKIMPRKQTMTPRRSYIVSLFYCHAFCHPLFIILIMIMIIIIIIIVLFITSKAVAASWGRYRASAPQKVSVSPTKWHKQHGNY